MKNPQNLPAVRKSGESTGTEIGILSEQKVRHKRIKTTAGIGLLICWRYCTMSTPRSTDGMDTQNMDEYGSMMYQTRSGQPTIRPSHPQQTDKHGDCSAAARCLSRAILSG